MQFNIAAFTHIGTYRHMNQDRILVQNQILSDGQYAVEHADACLCFVADGVGGAPHGELAAQFVLEQIAKRISPVQRYSTAELETILHSINHDLIEQGWNDQAYSGSSTTLVGMILNTDGLVLLNAGDSPAYILRDNRFTKLTEDHVMNPYIPNSPITSYFGGPIYSLDIYFNNTLKTAEENDLFILTSDGLLKSLELDQLQEILTQPDALAEKANTILQQALTIGAIDNLGVVVIQALPDESNSR